MRILVAVNDGKLNQIISRNLKEEGCSVDCCARGEDVLEFCSAAPYDVLVIDAALPGIDGLSTVRRLRQREDHTPVLLLSARNCAEDRVEGLEAGGDYVLGKPFDFRELIAAVRALTRKVAGNRARLLILGDLTLDVVSRTVTRAGRSIELTGKEFALLEYMLRNRGAVLSREQIENSLWNYEYEGGSNIVDVYIGYLRRKIDTGFDRKLIHTVWGRGWVLREE